MIRSLGSSLLAKAGTGSLTRRKDEFRITKPNIPGKAAVGTAGRDLVEETNITPVAPGSEKVVRSAPGIESASLPGMSVNQVPLVAGMGTPGTTPGNLRSGANDQALFKGISGSPASQEGQAGRQALIAGGGGSPVGAIAKNRALRSAQSENVAGAPTEVQGERTPFGESSLPNIGIFGSRVSAAEPEGSAKPASNNWQPTAGQYAAGAIGKALTNLGTKLGAPELTKGGLGAKLQTIGGSQSLAAAGKGSIETAVKNASNALRSVVQQANNVWNKLRSKFGR